MQGTQLFLLHSQLDSSLVDFLILFLTLLNIICLVFNISHLGFQTTDQNRALYPSWNMCNYIADVAMQMDNSKLAFYALEFMDKWITRGELARPPLHLSVDEGTVVSALATAARTYSSTLVDGASVVLQHSLRRKKPPIPECYIGKICAHASLGSLDKALQTLSKFEAAYGNLTVEAEDLFSPFSSLHPLVVACSKKGFETLDSVCPIHLFFLIIILTAFSFPLRKNQVETTIKSDVH